MKKYVVSYYDTFEPRGGMLDYIGETDKFEELKDLVKKALFSDMGDSYPNDVIQIFNSQVKKAFNMTIYKETSERVTNVDGIVDSVMAEYEKELKEYNGKK